MISNPSTTSPPSSPLQVPPGDPSVTQTPTRGSLRSSRGLEDTTDYVDDALQQPPSKRRRVAKGDTSSDWRATVGLGNGSPLKMAPTPQAIPLPSTQKSKDDTTSINLRKALPIMTPAEFEAAVAERAEAAASASSPLSPPARRFGRHRKRHRVTAHPRARVSSTSSLNPVVESAPVEVKAPLPVPVFRKVSCPAPVCPIVQGGSRGGLCPH